MGSTQRFSDPRVEKAANWLLSSFAAVALAVGAWFFRDLSGTVRELSAAVYDLRTEVAVLRVDRETLAELKSDQRALRERIRALETNR